MCLGMNPDQLVGREMSASSSNRNFIGRQGSPTGRTLLMSPAMVAAAAITGVVTTCLCPTRPRHTLMDIEKLTVRGLLARLTWKQLGVLLSLLGTLMSGSYYLGSKLEALRYEIKLQEKAQLLQFHKTQWSNIEPHLSLGKYFDLRKNVVSIHTTDIPKQSVPIDQQFLAPLDIPGLRYYKTTLRDYIKQTTGEDVSICAAKMSDLAPVHIWKGSEDYKITHPRLNYTLAPHALVQKLSKARLQNKLVALLQCYLTDPNSEIKVRLDKSVEARLRQVVSDLDRLDLVSLTYAIRQFSLLLMTAVEPDFNWQSSLVQKEEGVFYAGNLFTYSNVKVFAVDRDLQAPLFYVRDQTILVDVPHSIYIIAIIVPSAKVTLDVDFAELSNRWLSGLRLFRD